MDKHLREDLEVYFKAAHIPSPTYLLVLSFFIHFVLWIAQNTLPLQVKYVAHNLKNLHSHHLCSSPFKDKSSYVMDKHIYGLPFQQTLLA
jgi:hypothetical protein